MATGLRLVRAAAENAAFPPLSSPKHPKRHNKTRHNSRGSSATHAGGVTGLVLPSTVAVRFGVPRTGYGRDMTDPVEPIDPTDPTDPSDPTDPLDPIDPGDPRKPPIPSYDA